MKKVAIIALSAIVSLIACSFTSQAGEDMISVVPKGFKKVNQRIHKAPEFATNDLKKFELIPFKHVQISEVCAEDDEPIYIRFRIDDIPDDKWDIYVEGLPSGMELFVSDDRPTEFGLGGVTNWESSDQDDLQPTTRNVKIVIYSKGDSLWRALYQFKIKTAHWSTD